MEKILLGIFVALCGGAILALAMVIQRYALVYPHPKILFCKLEVSRNFVWFMGLVLYGVANGLYAMALRFGPLSLLSGVFTSLLVFNMLFARMLLGEELTISRVVGAAIIMVGIILCIIATPLNVETEFTPRDVNTLSASIGGAIYLSCVIFAVVISVAVICWFESEYPLQTLLYSMASVEQPAEVLEQHRTPEARPGETSTVLVDAAFNTAHNDTCTATGQDSGRPLVYRESLKTALFQAGASAETPQDEDVLKLNTLNEPPAWLDRVMGLVYPGSLGLDEGIAHLSLKAIVSMLDTCDDVGQCGMGTVYLFMVVWIVSSLATLWWLRRVFSRYETTAALPIEYGTLTVVSSCSGLIFYREHTAMTAWQIGVIVSGVITILIGIAIGRRQLPTRHIRQGMKRVSTGVL